MLSRTSTLSHIRSASLLPSSTASSFAALPSSAFTRSISHSASNRSEAATSASTSTPSILEEAGFVAPITQRPVTTRVFTNATLRRQALKQTQPWYIGPAEFRKIKLGGFGQSVSTKLPFELRQHQPEYEMRALRAAEVARLKSDPARHIDDFKAGDKIVVTKYLSLNDRTKFERIAGLCLARHRGTRLSASFLMRSHKLGEDYEMQFPLWSPFIAQIHRVEEGKQHFRQKMYYLRDRPRSGWEVKIPVLSKPTVQPVTVERVAKESNGKVVVLQHQPMKKILKQKRSGGIGAELAAAGGGDKKAAPKKK